MGEVYRAHDPQLGRDVAIKILPQSLSRDPDRLRHFEQEGRAAAALNHPNILAVYQFGSYVASMKEVHTGADPDSGPSLSASPDGSVLVLRDIGSQEVYALSVKWP
jgi:serine/threonine protein kinase